MSDRPEEITTRNEPMERTPLWERVTILRGRAEKGDPAAKRALTLIQQRLQNLDQKAA